MGLLAVTGLGEDPGGGMLRLGLADKGRGGCVGFGEELMGVSALFTRPAGRWLLLNCMDTGRAGGPREGESERPIFICRPTGDLEEKSQHLCEGEISKGNLH